MSLRDPPPECRSSGDIIARLVERNVIAWRMIRHVGKSLQPELRSAVRLST
jgi:hypothetical protein